MNRISVQRTEITKLSVDVIVNEANDSLREEAGTCAAIFLAAGRAELQAACEKIGHCDTGAIAVTPAFRLQARYILHAVGPIWCGGTQQEPQKLYALYQKSLEFLVKNNLRTIAFPLISVEGRGYPLEQVWKIAVQACNDFFSKNFLSDIEVIFVVPDNETMRIGLDIIGTIMGETYKHNAVGAEVPEPRRKKPEAESVPAPIKTAPATEFKATPVGTATPAAAIPVPLKPAMPVAPAPVAEAPKAAAPAPVAAAPASAAEAPKAAAPAPVAEAPKAAAPAPVAEAPKAAAPAPVAEAPKAAAPAPAPVAEAPQEVMVPSLIVKEPERGAAAASQKPASQKPASRVKDYITRYDISWLIAEAGKNPDLKVTAFWNAGESDENAIFSQWYCRIPFTINGRTYEHPEQYMMSEKALLFQDYEYYSRIMREKDPKECKALGRRVRGFSGELWGPALREIIFRGNIGKAEADEEFYTALMQTGDDILVEASPFDDIYGCGLGREELLNADRSLKVQPQDWHKEDSDVQAQNHLGFVLMGIRDMYRDIEKVEQGVTISKEKYGKLKEVLNMLA